MKKIILIGCLLVLGMIARAGTVTNAGSINVYISVKNGYSEVDNFPALRFNQNTNAFNSFVMSVTTATNAMRVPDVVTAGYAYFLSLETNGSSVVMYGSLSGNSTAIWKLNPGEICGPMRLATTNIVWWTTSGTGKLKGKVYAE